MNFFSFFVSLLEFMFSDIFAIYIMYHWGWFVIDIVMYCIDSVPNLELWNAALPHWICPRKVWRSRQSKDRQHNGQTKKVTRPNNDMQNMIQKSKDQPDKNWGWTQTTSLISYYATTCFDSWFNFHEKNGW